MICFVTLEYFFTKCKNLPTHIIGMYVGRILGREMDVIGSTLDTTISTQAKTKKNPLKNKAMMNRLNPFAAKAAEIVKKADADRHAKRAAAIKEKRSKAGKKAKAVRTERFNGLQTNLKDAYKAAEDLIAEEDKAGNYQPGETDEEDDE